MKNSNVCAETIQSNQEDIFFTIIQGLMDTGTQEEIIQPFCHVLDS